MESLLTEAGHEVRGFDLQDGFDILNRGQVAAAMSGIDGVVHLAAVPWVKPDTARLLATNVTGTWNVATAAAAAGLRRFIFLSSVHTLGVLEGDATLNYLPIDDSHSAKPVNSYGLSKLMAEEALKAVTARTGMTTICLRATSVWLPENYERAYDRWQKDPHREWASNWEYGSFLDVRDLAAAIEAALSGYATGHHRLLICGPDISADGRRSSREVAAARYPGVEWRGGPEYDAEPWRALVDTSLAQKTLGWTPRYSWREWLAQNSQRPSLRTRVVKLARGVLQRNRPGPRRASSQPG